MSKYEAATAVEIDGILYKRGEPIHDVGDERVQALQAAHLVRVSKDTSGENNEAVGTATQAVAIPVTESLCPECYPDGRVSSLDPDCPLCQGTGVVETVQGSEVQSSTEVKDDTESTGKGGFSVSLGSKRRNKQ
jgi:DnaJ-class molecular chaperone